MKKYEGFCAKIKWVIIISKANISYELFKAAHGFWNFKLNEGVGRTNQTGFTLNTDGPYNGQGVSRNNNTINIEKSGLYLVMGTLTVTKTTGAPILTLNISGQSTRQLFNLNTPSGGNISFSAGFNTNSNTTIENPMTVTFSVTGGSFETGSIGPQIDLTVIRLA